MSRKGPAPLRIAPLQFVVAEPITDPAEQAALDKLRKREKRTKSGTKPKTPRNDEEADADSTEKRRG